MPIKTKRLYNSIVMSNVKPLLPISAMMLLASCSTLSDKRLSMTPEYKPPTMVSTLAAEPSFRQDITNMNGEQSTAQWWQGFGGDILTGLVTELLENNPDLKITRARTHQAIMRAKLAGSTRLPSVNLGLDASVTRDQRKTTSNRYSLGPSVNWDADIFGGLRSAERAATLRASASKLRLHDIEQAQIARLTKLWIGVIIVERRLDVARSNTQSLQTTLDLTEQRYRLGSTKTSATNVQIARQNLSSSKANIPELEAQLAVLLNTIDGLLGRYPGVTAEEFNKNWRVTMSSNIPHVLPLDLLTRKYNIASAELSYRAALQDVGTAKARTLPSLSLSAAITQQTENIGDLFSLERLISTLAGSIKQTLFSGGALKDNVKLQKYIAQELAVSYANAVQIAIVDVENNLVLEKAYKQKITLLESTIIDAELANKLAQDRYRSGLTNLLIVLDTQRSLNAARRNLILAQQQQYETRIDLYQSLGGDWGAHTLENLENGAIQ